MKMCGCTLWDGLLVTLTSLIIPILTPVHLFTSPTSRGMTSILFEAVMGLSQSATMVSLLKELINSGDLDNVQDSAAVVVFLQSGTNIILPIVGLLHNKSSFW